jgi:hypothetical protein
LLRSRSKSRRFTARYSAHDGRSYAGVGVNETYRPLVKLNPVQPKNFLIDPAASSVDTAMGCAIDEYVSRHIVEELQEQGVYKD